MDALRLLLRSFEVLNPGQLQRILVGINLQGLSDFKIKDWQVIVSEVRGPKDGLIIVKSSTQSFSCKFSPDKDYPDVVEGTKSTVDAPIKDGRINAATIDPDDPNINTLPNPRINTDHLSAKEIDALISELVRSSIGIEKGYKYIELLIHDRPKDLSLLNKYASRIYYQTVEDDTESTPGLSKELHRTKLDKKITTDYPEPSLRAVRIMSNTPVYINNTLIESLPVIEPETADITERVLTNMDKRTFNKLQNAYKDEYVREILRDKEFISLYKMHDVGKMLEYLGLDIDKKEIQKNGKSYVLSRGMEVLFGITLKEFGDLLDVEYNPIITKDNKAINVFDSNDITSLSEALVLSDQYLKYNDVYDAKYNMFTSRGERMYAEGSNNFQSNTIMRENIRFAPVDPSNIDKSDYTSDLITVLGGALIEDGVVPTRKIKLSDSELTDIAVKYHLDGDYSKATPRIKTYLKALDNVDKFNVIDTGATATLDATFSGLAVNSAITGKTENISKINIHDVDYEVDDLNDLYSDVGRSLINKLVQNEEIDTKEARKLVKPAVMTAMYNSSENQRRRKVYKEIRTYLKSKYGSEIAYKKLGDYKEEINETVRGATDVLASTIKEKEIMSLIDKGIMEVYRPDKDGSPEIFIPKDENDLSQVAGVRIHRPDGGSSVLTNGEDKITVEGNKLIVLGNDHVKPYTEVTTIRQDKLTKVTNNKKLLDNVSTAIARTYDSYVASYVVDKLNEKGISVLTTHDAFTVPVYAIRETKELYNEAINNIYKFGGSDKSVNARNNLSIE